MNKLLRVDGPDSYRLMAFEQHDGRWIGKTAGGNSLREDIMAFSQPGRRPLYAVFVRPLHSDLEVRADDSLYLIRKRGLYYRPNAQGYTGSPHNAGRYTLAEAIRHSHPNGLDGPRDGMDYIRADAATIGQHDGCPA